ncbi:hypothetical protein PFISCL1PPCAC_16695, partial [Pristionchus fissidentatus]
LLLLLPFSSFSLNVLIFAPTLSYSHVAFNGHIAEQLMERGHRVTMVLSSVDNTVRCNGSSRAEIIRAHVGIPNGLLTRSLWQNPGPYEDSSPLNPAILAKLLRVSSIFVRACSELAKNVELISYLKSKKFDVGLVEQYDSCGFGLFTALRIPSTVWLSATAVYRLQPETLGVNYPLSYVPELFAHVDDRMSLLGKMENVLVATVTELVSTFYSRAEETKVFKRLGVLPAASSLQEISRRSHSIVLNAMPLFDVPMPVSTQILHVGGITVPDTTNYELDQSWSSVVDARNDGFVLVTFGAIAKTREMPWAMADSFKAAFAAFPNLTFIVKDESIPKGQLYRSSSNVVRTQWLPQLALMAQPQFRAIITHGGWSSILESIYAERPMILMPLFGDHAKNSQVVRAKKVGLLIDKMRVTPTVLIDAIQEIIYQPEYKLNCVKYARMLKDSAPRSQSDLMEFTVRRAAKMAGSQVRWQTPKEAFLSPFTVRGGDFFLFLLFPLLFLLSL